MSSKETGLLIDRFFVGREDALEAFEALLHERKQRVLFYQGEGGIGKTWLLRKLITDNKDRQDLLMASELIDLYSTRYHRISGVREAIIEFLGEEHFAHYRQEQRKFLDEREKPEEERLAESALRGLRERADEQFLKDCQNAYPDRIVVLLFDTFEQVEKDDVGYYILHDLPQALPNFILVIASRHPCPLSDVLIKRFELGGLKPEESERFFLSREAGIRAEKEALPVPYDPELRLPIESTSDLLAGLYSRVEGHPLKLDLAVLWLKVGATTADSLWALSDEEFDRALLEPLRTLGCVPGLLPPASSIEEQQKLEAAAYEIILTMAYLNRRFDQRFLEHIYTPAPHLADLSQALDILGKLPGMFFVKERPDGTVQLHDEMERLVREQLWKERDPSGEVQRELAQKAIELYDQLINEIFKEVGNLVRGEEREEVERKAQELRAERLGYVLRLDLDQGYEDFIANFDRNLEAREYGLCELFLNEIRPYEVNYTSEQRREIKKRRFQLALGRHDFDRADELADTPEQRVLVLTSQCESVWTTDPEQGRKHLLKALEICKHESLSLATCGEIELRLGLTCRALNQFEEAIDWYEHCKDTANQMDKAGAQLYARAQNNQGYIYAIMGRYDEARELAQSALNLRQRLGLRKEIGLTYSTLGEIARFAGDYQAADTFYNWALEIFEELHDPEWQAIALQERGECARLMARKYQRLGAGTSAKQWLDLAEKDLRESQKLYEYYNLSRDRSVMLKRLGRVLRDKGDVDKAKSILSKGFKLAEETGDIRAQLECLLDLAEVALKQKRFDELEGYLGQVERFEKRRFIYHYPVFEGLVHLLRGESLSAQNRYEEAWDEYCSGLIRLGCERGYGHACLRDRLGRLQAQLDELPDTKTKEIWCDRFIETWQQKGLDVEFPDLIWLCRRYKEALNFIGG